jgi:hypothetical protein
LSVCDIAQHYFITYSPVTCDYCDDRLLTYKSKDKMNHIRRAAYFNNNGASLLAGGDPKNAFQSLKTSLQTLATAIVELENEVTPPPNNAAMVAAANSNTNHILPSRAIPRSPMVSENDAPEDPPPDESRPFLYSKALVFYPKSTATSEDLSFYTSVVVFNLVLTYHSNGKILRESGLPSTTFASDLLAKVPDPGNTIAAISWWPL